MVISLNSNYSMTLSAFGTKSDSVINETVFEMLFRTHYASLVVYARRFLNDTDAARDVVQSVFIRVWERRDETPIVNIKGYLVQSVRNRCISLIKDRKRTGTIEEAGRLKDEEPELPDNELIEKVQEVIAMLPPQCQRVFVMNRFDGMKYKEIADNLGISVKTVEVHMGKALKFIREKLPAAIYSLQRS